MAAEPRLGAVPFREAIDFFRAKLSVPTAAWTDLWQDQHAIGFMVAGASTADLVAELRAAVDKGIAEGTTQAEFRRDFDAIVARHGWSYNGSPGWRSRVIFQTNLRTAYAAGKWQQAEALKETRPFLRYSAVMDQRTRPLHRDWHGTILPVGDEWWRTHYPPNGWNCRCTVLSLSQRDLDRRGWKVSERPPGGTREVDVPGRGRVEVPEGIDPGFGYNVGVAAQAARLAAAKLATMPADLGAVVAAAFPAEQRRALAEDFRAWAGRILASGQPDGSYGVLGALPAGVADELAVRGRPLRSVALILRANQLLRMVRDTKRRDAIDVPTETLMQLPELLAAPRAVLIEREGTDLLLVFDPPPGDQRLVKIVVRVNTVRGIREADGRRVAVWNEAHSGRLVQRDALTDPNTYTAILGEV